MDNYNFKKLSSSSILVKNGNKTVVLSDRYTAEYRDKNNNDILVIKNKYDDEVLESIDVSVDNISIDDVGKSYNEAEELYLELDSLGIFFLDNSKDIGKRLIGWQDFADSNTNEASPLVQTNVNGGEIQLTNNNNDTATDGNTNVNAETTVVGINDLWNTTTNTFDIENTGIEKNDLFDIRVHLNISSSIITQDFTVRLDFYDQIGGNGNYIFSLSEHVSTESLSAGVFRERIVNMDGYFGESILNGSAKLFLVGTKSFEVEVIGWKINIFKIAR